MLQHRIFYLVGEIKFLIVGQHHLVLLHVIFYLIQKFEVLQLAGRPHYGQAKRRHSWVALFTFEININIEPIYINMKKIVTLSLFFKYFHFNNTFRQFLFTKNTVETYIIQKCTQQLLKWISEIYYSNKSIWKLNWVLQ